MTHKNINKVRNSCLKCWMFFLRAEGIKKCIIFLAVKFFSILVIKVLDLDPDPQLEKRMGPEVDPDPH
jgi:hypothetical protein